MFRQHCGWLLAGLWGLLAPCAAEATTHARPSWSELVQSERIVLVQVEQSGPDWAWVRPVEVLVGQLDHDRVALVRGHTPHSRPTTLDTGALLWIFDGADPPPLSWSSGGRGPAPRPPDIGDALEAGQSLRLHPAWLNAFPEDGQGGVCFKAFAALRCADRSGQAPTRAVFRAMVQAHRAADSGTTDSGALAVLREALGRAAAIDALHLPALLTAWARSAADRLEPTVAAAVGHERAEVRRAAAVALQAVDHPADRETVLDLLHELVIDTDRDVRRAAVAALATRAPASLDAVLLGALRATAALPSDSLAARQRRGKELLWICSLLRENPVPEAAPVLEGVLADWEGSGVQLGKLWESWHALGGRGMPPAWGPRIEDPADRTAASLAHVAARHGVQAAVPHLVRRVEKVPAVQRLDRDRASSARAAVAALGALGHRESEPMLRALLQSRVGMPSWSREDHKLVGELVQALGGLGQAASRDVLCEAVFASTGMHPLHMGDGAFDPERWRMALASQVPGDDRLSAPLSQTLLMGMMSHIAAQPDAAFAPFLSAAKERAGGLYLGEDYPLAVEAVEALR